MTTIDLCNPQPPWINILAGTPGVVETLSTSITQNCKKVMVVRALTGERMLDFRGLFREFATQLAFPDYFGNNFNALYDCLTDLAWLPAEGYVVIIREAQAILANETADDFAALIELLRDVCVVWNNPVAEGKEWDRAAIPFHVVLHCSATDIALLKTRVQQAKVTATELKTI